MLEASLHREYVQLVKPLMPAEAFRRRPSLLLYFAAHLALVSTCVWAAAQFPLWAAAVFAVVIGHSFACIAFFAHELSHGSVLPRGALRRALVVLAWGVNLIPATLWDEVHNRVHHCHTNMLNDPDRRWLQNEAGAGPALYTHVLYPHSRISRWNPLVFVQFLGYIARNIIAALSGGHWGMLPAAPSYSMSQRLAITAELLLIMAVQVMVAWMLDWNLAKWAILVIGGQSVASAIVMAYVFTNHFLSPLQDECDPLAASVSVQVPGIIDWLHLHFSYHTEHHLFPAMDCRYTPLLSQKLRQLFPGKYTRIPIGEAWRRLWQSSPYAERRRSAQVDQSPH